MSKNIFMNNISQSYVKIFLSKNVSKISETPRIMDSKRTIKIYKLNNINNRNNNSTSKNLNNISTIMIREKKINPLITVYNNAFYPRSYKNKNYIKEMKTCLPPLTINNEYSSSKILMTDYELSLNKFNNIYNIKINDKEKNKDSDEDDDIIDKIKHNKINFNETTYIDKVLKDNLKQNFNVNIRNKEEFSSPKYSLLTLKINKDLIKNVSEKVSKYQYQTYANKINQRQTYKLKLCIMPKTNIKELKYGLDMNKQKDNDSKDRELRKNSKKNVLNKVLINKIAKKFTNKQGIQDSSLQKDIKNNKKLSKSDIYLNITEQNIHEGEKKATINSTLIRNALIIDVNLYYCKYLPQGFSNPNSRIEATFTPYFNNLFLFGGLQSREESDLWMLDTTNKNFSWKKIIFSKEINFNPRYGHTAVIFNDSLYIYGGKFNLKQLKYPLEDILVYHISSNTMKIGIFKNEKNYVSRKYIYIPCRRNHIAHVIGWNMIVHGGIDISKENLRDNYQEFYMYDKKSVDNKNNENIIINCPMLGDFMALDLNTFKWMKLSSIVQKKKNSKKIYHFKNLPRAYHSSCLVLTQEHIIKGNKLNIYRNDINNDEDNIFIQNDGSKSNFDIKFEGIYIFGGIDEYFKETNNLFILHCFRNPLVLFEPKINGLPPSHRQMASMNFNKILNYITIYGGKSINQVLGDLFILDIMNFQWINVRLFGASINEQISGHCRNN